jgi:hypothetical protein
MGEAKKEKNKRNHSPQDSSSVMTGEVPEGRRGPANDQTGRKIISLIATAGLILAIIAFANLALGLNQTFVHFAANFLIGNGFSGFV